MSAGIGGNATAGKWRTEAPITTALSILDKHTIIFTPQVNGQAADFSGKNDTAPVTLQQNDLCAVNVTAGHAWPYLSGDGSPPPDSYDYCDNIKKKIELGDVDRHINDAGYECLLMSLNVSANQ
jgi:hypothetical protein